MKATVINYIVVIFFAFVAIRNCTVPDYIHVCHHNDPDLAGCINNSIETLRPRLKAGIPELDVPPLDIFEVDTISFSTSPTNAARLKTNVTNIRVWGAPEFKILKLIPKLTKKGHTFQFEAIIHNLRIEGDYEIDSKILLLELKGKGPFYANITDYHFECILKGEKIQKEGKNHLHFEKMKCNLVIGKVTILLENLFSGNPLLGNATNTVINDNSDVFFDEIKPGLVDVLSGKFTDIANKITTYFTYEELFP